MTSRYPGGLIRKNAANTAITGASGVWDLGSQAQAVRNNTWPISGLANPVSGSLRFRSSASAYLNRTLGSSGSLRAWTWSAWIKRGTLGAQQDLFGWIDLSGGNFQQVIGFNSDNTLEFQMYNSIVGGYVNRKTTSQVFRDPSAWYHIVVTWDSDNATADDRARIYINGTRVTAWANNTNPSLNQDSYINNSSYPLGIGRCMPSGSSYFDGYMAEVNFINGQALTPSYFGQTSPITGVWEPVKYTGTYGTNGFYLSLSDTSSIGKDFSGNGNNWTPNNISTTSGATFDLMRDVPTQYTPQGATDVGGVVRGNYCTWNPLNRRTTTHIKSTSNGNLSVSGDSDQTGLIYATIYPTTGKWYFEFSPANTYTNSYIGIGANNSEGQNQYPGNSTSSIGLEIGSGKVYKSSLQATYTGISGGEIGMIAWDCDTGKVWMGRQGAWFNSGNPAAGTGEVGTLTAGELGPMVTPYSSSGVISTTFGQQSFTYAPPSGFKSLCTTNLPTPTIGATTATAANKYFDATLITGTAATQVITNAGGFQPDFVWLKSRTNANNPTIYDAIRGVNTILYPALTNAEQVGTAQLTAFNSNGFTLGASENANDSNGEASVGWQWNAGGSTVTNTAGSISSQVRANPTAGFSIVTYTGNATSSQTVGHGLGTTPTFFILKSRGIQVWNVYSLAGGIIGNTILQLNTTDAAVTGGNISLTASPTTIGFGSASQVNGSGVGFVAYVFAPVAGYSAFGSYTGNGSADGTFVYTGFRPRFVLYKSATSASVGDWRIHDTSRSTFNAAQLEIYAQSAAAEPASSNAQADILSNGFKLRGVSGNTSWNESGVTYIYAAFAETPFKNALAR